MSNPTIRFERLTTFEQFCALEQVWNSFGDNQIGTIFLTFSWLSEWWKVYGAEHQLSTLLAYQEDRVVGIVPLMLSRAGGFRKLMFMGSGDVTPNHLDIIARPECRMDVLKALADYLCKSSSEWDVIELDKIPSDSPSVNRLRDCIKDHGLSVQTEVSARCPYVDLPDSFDQVVENVTDSTQRHLRRSRRRLETEKPDARFFCVETGEKLKTTMDALIRLHQERWTRQGYPGAFSNQKFIDFHRAVSQRALDEGRLRMYYLQIDANIASVHYCYKIGDCLQLYMINFDERWSKYSPGFLSHAHAIENSIHEGIRRCDFLEGEEHHKTYWLTGIRDNIKLRVYSPSLHGKVMRFYLNLTSGLMDWAVRSVPLKIRRPIWQALQRWRAARK